MKLSDVWDYFRTYYERRRAAGLVVEKPDSIFAKGGYTDREAQRNILANSFKRSRGRAAAVLRATILTVALTAPAMATETPGYPGKQL